jgi:hypothetical protein
MQPAATLVVCTTTGTPQCAAAWACTQQGTHLAAQRTDPLSHQLSQQHHHLACGVLLQTGSTAGLAVQCHQLSVLLLQCCLYGAQGGRGLWRAPQPTAAEGTEDAIH